MKSGLLLLVAAMLVAPCAGLASETEGETRVEVQAGVASQHLFTDGLSLHQGPVEQLSVLAKLPHGLMIGVWHVAGLDDQSLWSNGGDEVAVGAGWYSHSGHFAFEAGVKHHANAGVRGQTTIPEIEAGWAVFRNISHKLELHINAGLPIAHGHIVSEISAGAEYTWRPQRNVQIQHRLSVQHNSPAHGREQVYLLVYKLGAAWTVFNSDHYTVRIVGPSVRLYTPIFLGHDYDFEHVYGASLDVGWHQAR